MRAALRPLAPTEGAEGQPRRSRFPFVGLGRRELVRLLLPALAVAASLSLAYNLVYLILAFVQGEVGMDLALAYGASRFGLQHGWGHLYDLDLARHAQVEVGPADTLNSRTPYLNPPPLAWLLAPLSQLPFRAAYSVWTLASLAALAAAWRLAAPKGPWRWLHLLGALAWLPVVLVLWSGQPALLIVVVVAAAWAALGKGRPVTAGVVLSLTAIKPHLAILVGPALLLAGHRRAVAAFLGATGVLAGLSVASLGLSGLSQYWEALGRVRGIPLDLYLTLDYLFDPIVRSDALNPIQRLVAVSPAATLLELAVMGVALVAAFRNRGCGPERPIAAGLVGSMLGAFYVHTYDFAVLLLAGWLFLRGGPPLWQRLWLLVPALGLYLSNAITPVPAMIGLAVWLYFLLSPPPAPSGAGRQSSLQPLPAVTPQSGQSWESSTGTA